MTDRDQFESLATASDPARLEEALTRTRQLTMAGTASLVCLAHQVTRVLRSGVEGDFVECGVWRGGASFLMADLLRVEGVTDRKVWMFDSFEGLPAPEEIDGRRALEYARETEWPDYFDNCSASYEEVEESATALGLRAYTEFVKGWFDQTLPVERDRIGPIAILRIDCDWYSSTRCVLDNLYDRVSEGGFVVLDDYYAYEGSALAVHEFLTERKLPHRVESVIGCGKGFAHSESAYFRKVRDASIVDSRPLVPAARFHVYPRRDGA